MSTIDTFVPGVPSQVVAGAEYFGQAVVDISREGASRMQHVSDLAAMHWRGESFDAYSSTNVQAQMAINEVNRRAHELSGVLWAYAGQIGRMESDFADMRDEARRLGLTVTGAVIHVPSPPSGACPAPESDPEGYDAWVERGELVEWCNARATEVGTRWGELEVWIAEHFEPIYTCLPVEGMGEALLRMIGEEGWSTAAQSSLVGVELHWQVRLPEIESRAAHLGALADQIGGTSGHPGVRDALDQARRMGMDSLLGGQARQLDEVARLIGAGLQWLPFAGAAVDVLDAGARLVAGDSIADIAVEFGGGVAAALVAGLVMGAVGAPVAVTVAAPAAAAVGGSMLASWMYTELVPLHVREGIEADLEGFWDFFVETQQPGYAGPAVPGY